MPDTKIYNRPLPSASTAAAPASDQRPAAPVNGGGAQMEPKSAYFVASPNGLQVPIPKELYVAFSDFIKTRKCPGSIAIQFRSGEITCVEALARKTYRNNT